MATYPRGHRPPSSPSYSSSSLSRRQVSPERMQRLVSHLHEESCSQKQATLQRLLDERDEEDFNSRRGAGVRLSTSDQLNMADRLCNNSMAKKAAAVEKLTAELYPDLAAERHPRISNEKVAALGKRLHDDSRSHASQELQKLFDKYVPPRKKVVLSEDDRYANADRLSSPKKKGPPKSKKKKKKKKKKK